VSGSHKGRKIFFNCAEGKCRFWQTDKRADGQDWCVDHDMMELLRRLNFIWPGGEIRAVIEALCTFIIVGPGFNVNCD
jgi:hypothetical protein